MHNMLLNKVNKWGLWGVPTSWLQTFPAVKFNISSLVQCDREQCLLKALSHIWTAMSDVASSLSWYVTLTCKTTSVVYWSEHSWNEHSCLRQKKINLSGQCKQGQILPYGISHGVNYIMMHALTRDVNSSSSQVSQRQKTLLPSSCKQTKQGTFCSHYSCGSQSRSSGVTLLMAVYPTR